MPSLETEVIFLCFPVFCVHHSTHLVIPFPNILNKNVHTEFPSSKSSS